MGTVRTATRRGFWFWGSRAAVVVSRLTRLETEMKKIVVYKDGTYRIVFESYLYEQDPRWLVTIELPVNS